MVDCPVKVAVRWRGHSWWLGPWEMDEKSVTFPDGGESKKTLTFDVVGAPDSGSEIVFSGAIREVVLGALSGVSGTVVAVGSAGSGKSRTLWGEDGCDGVVERGARALFEGMAVGGADFVVKVSCVEFREDGSCVDVLSGLETASADAATAAAAEDAEAVVEACRKAARRRTSGHAALRLVVESASASDVFGALLTFVELSTPISGDASAARVLESLDGTSSDPALRALVVPSAASPSARVAVICCCDTAAPLEATRATLALGVEAKARARVGARPTSAAASATPRAPRASGGAGADASPHFSDAGSDDFQRESLEASLDAALRRARVLEAAADAWRQRALTAETTAAHVGDLLATEIAANALGLALTELGRSPFPTAPRAAARDDAAADELALGAKRPSCAVVVAAKQHANVVALANTPSQRKKAPRRPAGGGAADAAAAASTLSELESRRPPPRSAPPAPSGSVATGIAALLRDKDATIAKLQADRVKREDDTKRALDEVQKQYSVLVSTYKSKIRAMEDQLKEATRHTAKHPRPKKDDDAIVISVVDATSNTVVVEASPSPAKHKPRPRVLEVPVSAFSSSKQSSRRRFEPKAQKHIHIFDDADIENRNPQKPKARSQSQRPARHSNAPRPARV